MSGYIGNIPVPQATQTRESFTATASQTTFNTAGYTPNFLDVFLNGVHLLNGTDYTATNGSDVVLTTGAAASDVVEVISYSTYEVNAQTYTGGLTVNNDGATVLTVDRATSDGTVIDLKKDGTTVGSIGSVSSKLTVGTGIGALQFDGPNQTIRPFRVDTNVTTDAALQLGSSTNRFTNLYLSGGVYLGGTGAANKLDDYEEGTWTASAAGTSGISNTTGYYQKVGNTVYFYWYSGAMTMSSAALTVISGLPFTCASGATNYPAILAAHNTYAPNSTGGYVTVGSTSIDLVVTNNIIRDTTPSSGTTYLMIAGHYKVA